ncbi:MAG: serine/threonine protein kinase [Deltaproteobacteria bacterium]|nr:serine/threonine protein kinase [Deltaproteobacteria bacterium]
MSDLPATIGPYEIVRRLGVGGMAEVFEARAHRAAGVVQPVCVKRILPAYTSDRRFVKLFVREARVSFVLHHGKIAQVFDFGHEEGEVYLAMELVDGRSVSELLRRLGQAGRAMPLAHALKIVTDVLEALEHAHTRTHESGEPLGIVHRDVSPQNVLVAFEGQVKLVDFGIARALAQAGREGPGGVQGKLPYLPPEQARGDEVDLRSDLYSAGALLFELLAGRPPYVGTAEAARAALLLGRIPQLAEVAPGIDPALADLVSWAMEPRPEDRPASAAELAEALLSWARAAGELASERELGELMRFGFADELSGSGREVALPPDYELTLHRRAPRLAAGGGRPWTAGRVVEVALLALVPLAVLVGAFWWAAVPDTPPWNMEVRSRPPGARILVDGIDTGLATDAFLQDLDRATPRRIRLELPSYQPLEQLAEPGTSVLALTLRPQLQVQVKPRPPPEVEPPPEPLPQMRVEEREGGHLDLTLDLARPAVDAGSWTLNWVDVDPRRRHFLTVSGDVLVVIGRQQDVGFWLARDGAGGHLGSGLVRPDQKVRLPPGTARLGLGVLDGDSCHNNADHLRIRIQSPGRSQAVRVDGRAHCISLGGRGLPQLSNLDGEAIYEVSYRAPEGGPAYIVLGYAGGNLMSLSRDPGDSLQHLHPGETVRLPYVQEVVLVRLEANLAGSPEARIHLEHRPGAGMKAFETP